MTHGNPPPFPPPFPPPYQGYPPQPMPQPMPPAMPPAEKPRVLTWFVAYATFMAIVYASCVAGGAWVLTLPEAALTSRDIDPTEVQIQGAVLLVIGLPLMLAFGVAPFLPRRKWVWVYDLVLIAIGLTSVCCLPITIPLLIYFIKPETKAWFESPLLRE